MKYELAICQYPEKVGFQVQQIDKVIGDSLTEVLAKLPLLVKQLEEKNCEERIGEIRASQDDDIPF